MQIDVVIKFGFDVVCSSVNGGRLFCMDPPPCGPVCSKWTGAKASSWISRISMYLAVIGTVWIAITWKNGPRAILINGTLGLIALTALFVGTVMAFIAAIRPDLDVDVSSVVNLPLINSLTSDPVVTFDSSFFTELAVFVIQLVNGALFFLVRGGLLSQSRGLDV
ncbi:hypothetical protein HDU67_002686 [Dinochytrium kinnereticum]|nr:hypothetical protein HDU67_002686 [Dinochytrium kinnereticum]